MGVVVGCLPGGGVKDISCRGAIEEEASGTSGHIVLHSLQCHHVQI